MKDLKYLLEFENLLEDAENDLVRQAQAEGQPRERLRRLSSFPPVPAAPSVPSDGICLIEGHIHRATRVFY